MDIKIILLIGLIVLGIILILRAIYFQVKSNELIEILFKNEIKNLSNEYFEKPLKVLSYDKFDNNSDELIYLGTITRSIIYPLKYKFENKTINSIVLLCEFNYIFLNFFEMSFGLLGNVLKTNKRFLFYEIKRDNNFRCKKNKSFITIPFLLAHEKIPNTPYIFYFENEQLFIKFKDKLFENYKLNKNITKADNIENISDKILSSADEIEIDKTGEL